LYSTSRRQSSSPLLVIDGDKKHLWLFGAAGRKAAQQIILFIGPATYVLCTKGNVVASGAASPRCWGAPNALTLSEQQYFVWFNAAQSTKRQEILEILGGVSRLGPSLATPVVVALQAEKPGLNNTSACA